MEPTISENPSNNKWSWHQQIQSLEVLNPLFSKLLHLTLFFQSQQRIISSNFGGNSII